MLAKLNNIKGIVKVAITALILLPIWAGAETFENVQISTSGSGGISNTTSAESSGDESSAAAFVRNVIDSEGNVDISIETEVDGAVESRRIRENVRDRGILEISIATSSEGGSASKSKIKVEIGDIESPELDSAGIFSSFVERIFPDDSGASDTNANEKLEVENIAMATSSEAKEHGSLVKLYRRILNTLKSFWQ
jgi:hypothetical protein